MSDTITRILARMGEDDLYEVNPLSGIFPAADVPRGYCGEAYSRDDPRLVVALEELESAGWHLPSAG